MPFLLVPLLAGGTGFAAGFFTNSALSGVVKVAALGAGLYGTYYVVTKMGAK